MTCRLALPAIGASRSRFFKPFLRGPAWPLTSGLLRVGSTSAADGSVVAWDTGGSLPTFLLLSFFSLHTKNPGMHQVPSQSGHVLLKQVLPPRYNMLALSMLGDTQCHELHDIFSKVSYHELLCFGLLTASMTLDDKGHGHDR